jgi:cyclic beta-1,2-glucan synthetase
VRRSTHSPEPISCASPALQGLLEISRDKIQPPIRSEIFGLERFAQHGNSLGLTHVSASIRDKGEAFSPRLRDNVALLRRAYLYIGIQAGSGVDISPAAQWLLDNFHLIEAQLGEIDAGLPATYFRALPVLQHEPLAGLPRIYSVAWAFVSHTDSAFNDNLLVHFLNAYQESCPLALGELWALPTTLRLVLVENLRRLAERVAGNKAARELANICFDRPGGMETQQLADQLAFLNTRGLGEVFLGQLAQRVHNAQVANAAQSQSDKNQGPALQWLNEHLPDPIAFQRQQRVEQTADNLSVSNAVKSLRAIGDADWSDVVAKTSLLVKQMQSSAAFCAEHMRTRDQVLHDIEHLAKRSQRSELEVAQVLLGLMASEGLPGEQFEDLPHPVQGQPAWRFAAYWLNGLGRKRLRKALGLRSWGALIQDRRARPWIWSKAALPLYMGAVLFSTLGVVGWLMAGHPSAESNLALMLLGFLMMLFPASEAVVAVLNRLISESVRPVLLPRLALSDGIPPEHRVLVVIPGMLTSTQAITALVRRLQLHYLANPEPHAQFALLTDWADADQARIPSDSALLAQASAKVRALNQRYPAASGSSHTTHRFLLLHRERQWCESEQCWMGWERKRGKLEQLVAALAEGVVTPFLDLAELSQLAANTPYVVTLDSDTELPPGRLRELVSVAAHPQNAPQVEMAGRRVVRGYGILQPRVSTPLPQVHEVTPYHWLFAGQCGVDSYSVASSEVYQDVFGEGSFSGKGLLHVHALHLVLSNRLPLSQVLSHDLLEGSMVRCAAVSDITVIEDSPFHADVAASRIHRWTRGDWQLLPLMMTPQRYGLRALHLLKMADNLRRSLVAPVSLLLLVSALLGFVVPPWVAILLVIGAFSSGPLIGAVASLAPSRDDIAKRHFYQLGLQDLARALLAGVWNLVQLLPQAVMSVDAITRALYRTWISRRRLLEWTTAATAQARAATAWRDVLRQHRFTPVQAALLTGVVLAAGTPHPFLTVLLGACWAASPLLIGLVSRPVRPLQGDGSDTQTTLAAPVKAQFETIARDTWRYFERSVTVQDNHLPPDNIQTLPHEIVAHRTSPTNVGLYLLSVACAREFGWIDTPQLLARAQDTLTTLATLPRHRGHFLNWYDTQTCQPLLPMYVSTVDSGNLCGHLLAFAQACLAGIAFENNAEQARQLEAVAADCERLANEADFVFLYHPKRHLLHIGYRVAEQQLDMGFYDLLASESRLTSLFAIAKGDLPVAHWAALGRPFFGSGSKAGLRSWSGSMFEYLMPTLVLREPNGSVLHEACVTALAEQKAFAREHRVPWGISESAHAERDHTLAYQYAPQGVPRLALRRAPADELVVAPYATALAAQIDAQAASVNYLRLENLAPRQRWGYIDALDFTASRQNEGHAFTPVSTFMAHHQGMTLVALANVLLKGVVQRWGMSSPAIEAVASLLHERVPREVLNLPSLPANSFERSWRGSGPSLLREVVPGMNAVEPTHLISNGRYHITLRANGAGSTRWGQTGLGRWRDDALRDACGHFLYGRAVEQVDGPLFSLTQHPAPDAQADYQSTFHPDRVVFNTTWPRLETQTTVWVSPEDDIEFRQVEIHNLDDKPFSMELVSALDVTLADPRADEAHPAFSNMFVQARWLVRQRALAFSRTPRLATEKTVHMAHFLVPSDDAEQPIVRIQTNRQHWLGRNRGVHQPLGQLYELPAENPATPDIGQSSNNTEISLDTGLDPVCALAVRLHIPANGKVQVTFAMAASDNWDTLHAVIDKYRQINHVQRASLMSTTLASINLQSARITPENFAAIQSLTSAVVMSLARPRQDSGMMPPTDRRVLWRFGISGDRPLCVVSVATNEGLGLVRSVAQALRVWARAGLACDLVVLNLEATSYHMALQHELVALKDRHINEAPHQRTHHGSGNTSFHVLRNEEVSEAELSTLRGLACWQVHADGRPFVRHVQEWLERHEQALRERIDHSQAEVGVEHRSMGSKRQTTTVGSSPAQGQFLQQTGEFCFEVDGQRRPQKPWINVLANPQFGTQLSETGSGPTWALNSRLMQLTAWSNDPVADPPSEWLLLQDLDTRETWSLAPSAWGDSNCTYQISHGQGWSRIAHVRNDLTVSASWCVDPQEAMKQVSVRVSNTGRRHRSLRLVGLVELMMGSQRSDRNGLHTTLYRPALPHENVKVQEQDGTTPSTQTITALLCTQNEKAQGFGGGTAFFATWTTPSPVSARPTEEVDWTCDRREFFDARGRLALPDHLQQMQGHGLDPCAALEHVVTLPPGESVEHSFLLGYAGDADQARAMVHRCAARPARKRLEQAREQWDDLLSRTSVNTPDPLFNVLVNRWLIYQTVSCRLWAKAAFYQAGGATGFRDQLQDTMALVWAAPDLLREQLLVCASRQFREGDVQHWWHQPGGAGVRTHFSDDLLWLPLACAHYVEATGDVAILDESVPFLEGVAIPPGAEDVYNTPIPSDEHATLWEHAARTLDRSLRVGIHGLPLMGSGDWNDGMNRVGTEGRGESVWLGWFLSLVVQRFAPMADARGEEERSARWRQAAQGWNHALLGSAWDGAWFKRAYFDDGSALGSKDNPEARIDLIAQAWSVLSGVAPTAMQTTAMQSVHEHLLDRKANLLRLLHPPLVHAQPSAGYIQAYPPGVRENGGQYSHGAIWALMAQAQLASSMPPDHPLLREAQDRVYDYFTALSPAHRAAHPEYGPVYGVEPYVMAADVYTHEPYIGRGGWSWYTGAAGWMHRAALESVFGLAQNAQELSFTPCLPSHWPHAELNLRRGSLSMRFIFRRTSTIRTTGEESAPFTHNWQAKLLHPRETLRWSELNGEHVFIVPLIE